MKTSFFKVIRTTSSEVSKKNLFNSRDTVYIPDFFIVFFGMTLFCFSVGLDICLVFFLSLQNSVVVMVVFALSMFPHAICEYFFDGKKNEECIPNFKPNGFLQMVFYLLGFGSIFTCTRILTETFALQKTLASSDSELLFPFPFFHISNENLQVIKIYCCINLVLKSIPQLLITSIFILESHVTGIFAILLEANILFNILIFSLTMATTFPIRRTPRVFTSCTCIVFNALSKFMATMCACCMHLAIFGMVFKKIKYYVFLMEFFKSLIWVWPCWRVMKLQPIRVSRCCFAIYFVLITVIFSYIYIHPFEGRGKQSYYLFYLLSFLYDLFSMYVLSDTNVESVSYYFTLRIIMLGFLACFGLLNILHKYREDKYVLYMSYIKSEEINKTDQHEAEEEENGNLNFPKGHEEKKTEQEEGPTEANEMQQYASEPTQPQQETNMNQSLKAVYDPQQNITFHTS